MTTKIDMNKYDRILRTYGINAAKNIQLSSVYILGLKRGYAGEICKNLALTGINTIYLIGNEIIDNIDMKYWCYKNLVKSDNIDNKCSIILQKYIKELNSMVNVVLLDEITTIRHNSCMVVINRGIEEACRINTLCRLHKSKMVYMMSSGLAGSVFVDCMEEHTVMDTTGEIKETIQIKDIKIESGQYGIIHCSEHNLMVGDIINNSNYRVIDTNKYNFKIVDKETNSFSLPENFKFINGSVTFIPQPTTFKHMELKDIIKEGVVPHFSKDSIVTNLNNIIMHQFDIVENCYLYTKDLIFEPVVSIIAGFASSEIIKLVGMKYTPLNQLFTWSDYTLFPSYDSYEQVNIMYNNIINYMNNQKILLVGCGALGCEWLKNLAMLNTGMIDIVDYDHIEHSNLTRQLLFRYEDVGKSKCKTAVEMIHSVNPNITLKGYENKISEEDTCFTNMIFKDKTIVISALDNIRGRRYVDTMCFDKLLPLFESGTMGTKGNTMPIIPFLTETYSNMSDPEDIKQFPICTIKNFPNQIQHTIHWAIDYFDRYNRGPTICNKYIEDNSILEQMSSIDRNQAIDDINYFLSSPPLSWNDCSMKAKDIFEKLFNHDIIQLLHCFPENHMIDNELFWSHGKICPAILDFTSIYAINFIESTTHILCSIYNINNNFTRDDIIGIITNFTCKVNTFIPLDIKIAKEDKEINSITNITNSINLHIDQEKLKEYNYQLNPIVFEKDDDSNYHISCINSMSNCRATNYNIKTISDYEAKGIAGNIIPAVATTTSTIVGLIAIELLKYVNKNNNIEHYRSWFINMADNTTIYSEPVEAPCMIVGKTKINGWTKFRHNERITLENFIKKYENMFNTKIFMILYQSNILYSDFTDNNINNDMYNIIKDNFDIDIMEEEVNLLLVSEDNLIEIPPIILTYKN